MYALPLVSVLAVTAGQTATVVITEVQSDPAIVGGDDSEWVEVQNISTTPVAIDDWSLNDYSGSDPSNEAATRWRFPAGTTLAAGQVVIVAKFASEEGFFEEHGFRPDFELGSGSHDDPMVPNLIPDGGTSQMLLSNSGTGDAVVLRDAGGVLVSGCEWGSVDRTVPGSPAPEATAGESLVRIDTTGDSSLDYEVATIPTPGEGFTGPTQRPPVISAVGSSPTAAVWGQSITITASVSDADGVEGVSVNVAVATSTSGPASGDYVALLASASGGAYAVTGAVAEMDPALAITDPSTFHDAYLRYFVRAEDTTGAVATSPNDATTGPDNASYLWQNVLPSTGVATIAEARAQDENELPLYEHHMVRVEGVVLTRTAAFVDGRTNFFIVSRDGSDAIRVFDDPLIAETVAPGDEVRVTGRVGAYRGVRQIGRDERTGDPALQVEVLFTGGAATPVTMTVNGLLADGEAMESQLVRINGVTLVSDPAGGPNPPAAWPGGETLYVDDGTGVLALRIGGTVGMEGNPTPLGSFDIVGIFTQFAPGGTGGYQLQPRGLDDVLNATYPSGDAGVMDGGNLDSGISADSGGTTDSGAPRPDTGVSSPDAGGTTGPQPDAGFFGVGDGDGDAGCGCNAAARSDEGATWALFVLALGAGLLRRRRMGPRRR